MTHKLPGYTYRTWDALISRPHAPYNSRTGRFEPLPFTPKQKEEVKMTHTPGPWSVGEFEGLVTIEDAERNIVARPPWPVNKADARLIAAAPMLLETLEAIRKYGKFPDFINELIDAAIAQAKGE